MPSTERRLALQILTDVEAGKRTLGELLAQPKIEALPPRDRGFLHELVLGTLRHRGRIDHALARAIDRPLAELDPAVRECLRLGAYQVLMLRVADHAAVSESVDLVRENAPRAAGFVNAVLRRLAREGAPAAVDPVKDPLTWLTSEGSLPRWLAERWMKAWGAPVAVARARAFLEPAPATFRVNPRRPEAAARIEAAGLAARVLPLEGAWEATAGRPIELAREGLLYLQDLGSQVVARLAASPGDVLDACAAPGGKSLLLADLHPDARVTALDVSPRRLASLAALAARWGAARVQATAGDAGDPPFAPARFDSVLLDAPCSGLGTLGRNPDIRWRVQAPDIAGHAARQHRLIASAAELVKPGGRLVYSACTLEPEETDEVVRELLKQRGDLALVDPPAWAAPFTDGPFVRVRPEVHRADGFFAAVMTRATLRR